MIAAQSYVMLLRLNEVLRHLGADLDDVVKINLFSIARWRIVRH
jgi:hypothetical protein